ncbi:hypothetical protein FHW11_004340 [Pantoea agglomerans]|uniref:hypothetical protein n=1 Tax=Enterobacter agglomerans TaxID=549 RepID=UPI0015F85AC4|nr:hypothetical protein [Pantoea agglomerans]MBA8867151.1 hypothetical protein [Pantoea agglomerans]MBA8894294.1 hypothetical protein [Pantoea agglomerans]
MECEREKINLIFQNSTDFLNAGIEILAKGKVSKSFAKLALLSIQTSVELLAKYRLAADSGLDAIKFKTKNSAQFRTKNFSDVIKIIDEEYGEISEYEKEVFFEVASIRNDLVHFSSSVEPKEIEGKCLHLLSISLPIFAMAEKRDEQEMSDYRWFLSPISFKFLINNEMYRAEAIDNAYAFLGTEGSGLNYCPNCKCESLLLRESEINFCHCCGYTIGDDIIKFSKCSICFEHSVAYDYLNEQSGCEYGEHSGLFYGRCIKCDEVQWVSYCGMCGDSSSQEGSKPKHPSYSCGCLAS